MSGGCRSVHTRYLPVDERSVTVVDAALRLAGGAYVLPVIGAGAYVRQIECYPRDGPEATICGLVAL